jgi:Uncharacterised nucleotidyltransferase
MIPASAGADRSGFDPIDVAMGFYGSVDGTNGDRVYSPADVAAAHRDWLTGVVYWGYRTGRISLGDDALVMLESLTQQSLVEAVTLESRAVSTISALTERGIESRLLKGVAVAHLDYDTADLRLFGDVDVLVHGGDMAASVAILGAAGFHRHYPEPQAGYDEFVGKGVAVEDSSRSVVDLHRTLALGYFGTRLPTEELWSDPERFEVGGVEVTALPRVGRFVHCALHLALAPSVKRVNGLDLCVIAGAAPVTTQDVVATAHAWRCPAPVAIAVRSTCEWFGTAWAPAGLAEWARDYRPRVGERIALTSYTGRFAHSRWRSVTAVAGLSGGRHRALALRSMITRGAQGRG